MNRDVIAEIVDSYLHDAETPSIESIAFPYTDHELAYPSTIFDSGPRRDTNLWLRDSVGSGSRFFCWAILCLQTAWARCFLATVDRFYDLAIWSFGSEHYIARIARALQGNVSAWKLAWSNSRCVQRIHPETSETIPSKDLKKVKRQGYSLERILIVDDTPEKVCRNYGNAIYIPEYFENHDDESLLILAKFLIHLNLVPNFRVIEKSGWRSTSFS